MTQWYKPVLPKEDSNWSVLDKDGLSKTFLDYVNHKLPAKAKTNLWPIQHRVEFTQIILDSVLQQTNDYLYIEAFLSTLTSQQLLTAVKICLEIDIAGLYRLALYYKISSDIRLRTFTQLKQSQLI